MLLIVLDQKAACKYRLACCGARLPLSYVARSAQNSRQGNENHAEDSLTHDQHRTHRNYVPTTETVRTVIGCQLAGSGSTCNMGPLSRRKNQKMMEHNDERQQKHQRIMNKSRRRRCNRAYARTRWLTCVHNTGGHLAPPLEIPSQRGMRIGDIL